MKCEGGVDHLSSPADDRRLQPQSQLKKPFWTQPFMQYSFDGAGAREFYSLISSIVSIGIEAFNYYKLAKARPMSSRSRKFSGRS